MNVVVGQSGGPTTVINASLAGVFVGAAQAGADKIYGMQNGIQGFLQERFVDLKKVLYNDTQIDLLKRTPACFLGSCRYKLKDAEKDITDYEKIFAILKKYEIDCFLYIGGNDSMDTVAKLSAYGKKIGSNIRFVGVPKTIDNDLTITDHTPGYGSAAKFVATTMKELVCDSTIYDTYSVTIVEVMGRDAGWLTAASALAKGEDCDGVDMICLPEVPFTLEGFLDRVSKLLKTKKSLVIAVSEGVKLPDGRYVCELASEAGVDVFGHKQLTGTASFLASVCAQKLKTKTRAIELSTLQRCAGHIASLTDVNEAFEVGRYALNAAVSGKTGVAGVFVRKSDSPYECGVDVADVHLIANQEKSIPLDWIDVENWGLKPAFLRYARPLIQGELAPAYADGLPRHIRKEK